MTPPIRPVYQVAGVRATAGTRHALRVWDDLPTQAELRAMVRQVNASNRQWRRGRPGRLESPAFWARLHSKLVAAARSGRGLRYLSRDELDAILRRLAMTAALPTTSPEIQQAHP